MIGSADAGREPGDQAENDKGVDVVRELKVVEMVAGKDGEDAVEAGDLVDQEGEVDELGRGAQGDEVEERLRRERKHMSAHGVRE